METLKSLLNQRDCQDGVITKCNLQIQQYDLNIKSTQLKMAQMNKTMEGNIEERKLLPNLKKRKNFAMNYHRK